MRVAPKRDLVREIRRQRALLATFKWLLKAEKSATDFWRNRYTFLHAKLWQRKKMAADELP